MRDDYPGTTRADNLPIGGIDHARVTERLPDNFGADAPRIAERDREPWPAARQAGILSGSARA